MQQHFTTIEDCQDVYVLCTIIAELFSGSPEADAAVEVKRKMNEWAHSNSGDIYWRDENVKHRNSLFCAQLVCKTFGEDELSTEERVPVSTARAAEHCMELGSNVKEISVKKL